MGLKKSYLSSKSDNYDRQKILSDKFNPLFFRALILVQENIFLQLIKIVRNQVCLGVERNNSNKNKKIKLFFLI